MSAPIVHRNTEILTELRRIRDLAITDCDNHDYPSATGRLLSTMEWVIRELESE